MGSIVNSNRGSAYVGIGAKQPRDWHEFPRDPNQYDNGPQYNVGDEAQNTITKTIWQLVSKAGNATSAGALSTWVQIGATSGTVTNLTGNSGGLVAPTAGNINVIGDTVGINIVGTPGTSTLTASLVGGGVATQSYVTDSGTATPTSAGVLNVLGGTGVNTAGASHTVSIAIDGDVATTYDGNSGSATPSSNIIHIVGDGTTATTVASGNTVTITAIGGGGAGLNQNFFGNGGPSTIGSTSAINWETPYGQSQAVQASGEFIVPTAGTISNLYVNVISNASTTNGSVTLNKNGSNTTLKASLTALTTGVFTDLTHSFSVVAGDTIQFEFAQATTGNIIGTVSAVFSSASGGGTVVDVIGGNNITITGTSTLNPVVNVSGTTNHCVQIGNSTGSLTSVTNGTTGQVLTAQTGADPIWAAGGGTNTTYSFLAYNSNLLSNQTGDGTVVGPIPFNATIYNNGSYYDTGTFLYTAPVNGIYIFGAAVHIGGDFTSAYGSAQLYLSVLGNPYIVAPLAQGGTGYNGLGITTLVGSFTINLTAGQTIAPCYFVGTSSATPKNIGMLASFGTAGTTLGSYFWGSLLGS